MSYGLLKNSIDIPEGVNVTYEDNIMKISGKKGSLTKKFKSTRLNINIGDGKIEVKCELPRKKESALVGTWTAHIKNMISGVTNGFEYKMKAVYSHFPMKINVRGDVLFIDNFIGEKVPRKANIVPGVDVKVKGQEVIVSGIDKERVGQTCANIEMATKIRNYDRRVFQDGIYLTERGTHE